MARTVTLVTFLLLAPIVAKAEQPLAPPAEKTVVTVAATTPEFTRKGEGDILELKDGRLLIVYMEFAGDGSDFARTRFVAQESADGGRSWSGHRVIATTEPGDVNVYSPNLLRSQDENILLVFMRQHNTTPLTSTVITWYSDDEGQTFQPRSEYREEYSGVCNAVLKRLPSGRLLLPVTKIVAAEPGRAESYSGAVLLSDDDGKHWREAGSRVFLPMRGVMEPHVEATRDGRVLMVMRSQLGSLFLSESSDDGQTWSKPQPSGLRTPESCPELTRIPETGDLLMIWNNSPYDPAFRSHFGKRSPLTAAVSRDEGRTWTHLRDIEDDPRRAYSNPGCRFTSTGKAIVNYWTCEYLPDWAMQDVIDLRIAIIDSAWFYKAPDAAE